MHILRIVLLQRKYFIKFKRSKEDWCYIPFPDRIVWSYDWKLNTRRKECKLKKSNYHRVRKSICILGLKTRRNLVILSTLPVVMHAGRCQKVSIQQDEDETLTASRIIARNSLTFTKEKKTQLECRWPISLYQWLWSPLENQGPYFFRRKSMEWVFRTENWLWCEIGSWWMSRENAIDLSLYPWTVREGENKSGSCETIFLRSEWISRGGSTTDLKIYSTIS